MHIFLDAVDLSSREMGGVRRYYTNLIQELVALQTGLVLYADSLNGLESVHSELQFMRRRTFRGRRRFPIDNILLDWAFARSGCDIFHSCYYSYPLFCSRPSVVTAFDMIHERFPQYFTEPHDRQFMQLKKRAFQCATRITAISESTKQDIMEIYGVPPGEIEVIHLGVEPLFHPVSDASTLSDFRQRYDLHEPFMLFTGTRHFYKNFTALLEAYFRSGLARKYLLVVIGSRPEWRREEIDVLKTSANNQENRVRLLGYLMSEEDLVVAYSAAEALVYPSLYEGFGLPVLEAMACGTPVVCSSSSSLPEVGGDAAIYFQGGDKSSLIDVLRSVPLLRTEERIRRGIGWAKSFTWRETARLTKQVYESLA